MLTIFDKEVFCLSTIYHFMCCPTGITLIYWKHPTQNKAAVAKLQRSFVVTGKPI